MPARNWGEALNQFSIIYGARVPLWYFAFYTKILMGSKNQVKGAQKAVWLVPLNCDRQDLI
jgi:hypothetical protein